MPLHEAMPVEHIFCKPVSEDRDCPARAAARCAIKAMVPRYASGEKVPENSIRRRRALGPALSSVLSLLSLSRSQAVERQEQILKGRKHYHDHDEGNGDDDDDIDDHGDYNRDLNLAPISPPGSRIAIFLAGSPNYVSLLLSFF